MFTKILISLSALTVFLFSGVGEAQTVRTCAAGWYCPQHYYWENQPCLNKSCSRSYAPTVSELSTAADSNQPRGLVLSGNPTTESANEPNAAPLLGIRLCAPDGMTLLGTGKIRLYTYGRWDFQPLPWYEDINVADSINTAACGTPDGGTTPLTCKCVQLKPVVAYGPSLYYVGEAINVGVSGSAAGNLKVDLNAFNSNY